MNKRDRGMDRKREREMKKGRGKQKPTKYNYENIVNANEKE